ncbi:MULTISPECIES: TetR/AcrR family transcriptional regulator [unclassified Arthrobacter]|uniref:TetR/AcrR family transcriptional regulator n=1 Tax=unclassified Arthrobacter TaxID=235627 RepID=UPI001E5FD539|nr:MULTISPECIES: TetR/AcrR family transcriptional regulator [unclassified Arthrobacter]MCC9144419.1 TetR/AcrR family transcriptional regulator [Arthrobacter sp. zg-Y919]MDK1275645.1 helix-turn-helix domain-containing protein [Arthrobacter sp. zg.Y919]MDM7991277.1 helix-turn-helix domain-containing protein [Arthrobacter sp. zg-Y877]WIB02987.1 helix-turn-helix domain-containing protein [Arthrobacter sp. zg-Y919]
MTGRGPSQTGLRDDAARNHRRLMEAAMELVAAGGADALTMDALAGRARVGKGTVFRRFGSRAGLMQELLDHAEQDFRKAYLSGPPPLGPGAPPRDRLQAFGMARLASLEVNGELARAADVDPRSRYQHPSHILTRQHLAGLLRQPGSVPDPELAAYQLTAFLDAGLLLHLHGAEGMSLPRLRKGWEELVDGVMRVQGT